MKRVLCCFIAIVISVTLISCINRNENSNSNIDNNIADESYVEYEIPEVFVIRSYQYGNEFTDEYTKCTYYLYDQNGNEYVYERPENTTISIEELYANYENGLLDNEIKLNKTFDDKREIKNCVAYLINVLNNEEYEVRQPKDDETLSYCMESPYHEEWYGLYYNDNHELNKKLLKLVEMGYYEKPNDKNAINIVNWLEYNEYY